MRRATKLAAWAAAVLCLGGLAAEKADEVFWGLSDRAAVVACRKWSAVERRAWQAYEKEVSAANNQLRTDLETIQKQLIDANKLEEAVKVKQAIDDLKAGKWPNDGRDQAGEAELLRPAFARKLHGTQWKHHTGWIMTLNAQDMSTGCSVSPTTGTWAVLSADTIRVTAGVRAQGHVLKLDKTGKAFNAANGNVWTFVADAPAIRR